MKTMVKIALVTGALALACGNVALAAGQPEGVPPHGKNAKGKGPTYTPDEGTPGPKNGLPAQAKAHGRRCKGESKKHVKGEKGTAFSRCVKALARADKNENLHPKKACKALSKKHVKGQKGTPFSQCVKGVNQMRKEEAAAVAASSTA